MVLPSSGSITRTSSGQDSPSVMSRTSISEGETRTPPSLSRHSSQSSLKNAPWSRSSSQPGWRSEKRYIEVDDHTWSYLYEEESQGHPIMGFGSVPIASYENIAKLPDRSLKVRNITWNINEKSVKILDHLTQFLLNIEDSEMGDMVTISLQEIPPGTKTFHEDALKVLAPALSNHTLYYSLRYWSQMLLIYIRRQHIKFAIEPSSQFVPSAPIVKPVRTKGAIGVCLRLYQRWIVIIACHLSHSALQQRVHDYHKLIKTFSFPPLKKFHGSDSIFSADAIIWTGDLNFRVPEDIKIDWKKSLVSLENDINEAIKNDELAVVKHKALAFVEFTEAQIRFLPTHKFVLGTEDYVARKNPSYTDRILHWSKQPEWVQVLEYNSVNGPTQSDHKPVYAVLRLNVITKPIPERYYSATTSQSRSSTDLGAVLQTCMSLDEKA